MSAFKNRLARLERVKRIFEEEARAAWAERERNARECEDAVSRVEQQIEASRAEQRRLQAGQSHSIAEVLAGHAAIDGLMNQRNALARVANEARRAADEVQHVWQEKRSDVLALERLSERALESHREEEKKADADRMNEVALGLDARKSRQPKES